MAVTVTIESPAPSSVVTYPFPVYGHAYRNGVPVPATVALYDDATSEWLGATTADASGYWYMLVSGKVGAFRASTATPTQSFSGSSRRSGRAPPNAVPIARRSSKASLNTIASARRSSQVVALSGGSQRRSSISTAATTGGGGSGIAYVGVGALHDATVSASTQFSLGIPVVSAGDLMIAFVGGAPNAAPSMASAGWTQIVAGSVGAFAGSVAWWKRAGSNEVDAVLANGANDGEADVACQYVGRIHAFRGVAAAGSPFDVAPGAESINGSAVSVTAVNGKALTTATANAMIVMVGGALGFAPTYSAPGGPVDTLIQAAGTGAMFCAYDDAPANSAGAKAAPTLTSTSAPYTTLTLALKAA